MIMMMYTFTSHNVEVGQSAWWKKFLCGVGGGGGGGVTGSKES